MQMDCWRCDMLDTSSWKPFLLSDIFEIKKGKRLTKENQTLGDTVFIGATACNNGITSYIGQEAIHEGNTISLTYNGSVGEAFYQPEPFWASDDVNVLYPKNFVLNENLALFFCTILRLEKQMWSYARKWNLEQMNKTQIHLPATCAGKPDYDFMANYINTLEGDVSDIPDYFLNEGYEKACWYLDNINQEDFEKDYAGIAEATQINLTDRKWLDFCLDDLFYITPGKYIPASEYAEGDVPYITSSAENNGIKQFISLEGMFKGNSITTGKIHCDAFYQEKSYCASSDANILVPKYDGFTKAMGLFIVSVINFSENSKWNYGRQCRMGDSKKIVIKLPAINKELPDYDFMEKYIKSLPFSANI